MSLRVLHSVSSLNLQDGGPARSVPALAQAEAAHGADVTIWTQAEPTIDRTPFPDVRFVWGDLTPVDSTNPPPDIIHDHGLWLRSNHRSARLGRHQRVPRVVSPRGMLEPWCLKHHQLRKQVAWRLYQRRDLRSSCALHATSSAESDQFRKLGFRQPVISLPNGVTLPTTDDYQPKLDRQNPSDRKTVLFLSRLHPVKNVHSLIEAWSNVACDAWQLRIVGSGDAGYRRELARLIRQRQLAAHVSLEDAIHSHEKWQLFTDADVVVLPSFSENFGIVVAEALGMGTPVIVTTGMPWDGVIQRECGWQVAPTVEGLTTGLRAATGTSLSERKEMGRRGRNWVRHEYSWHDIGRRMLTAYDWMLGRTTKHQQTAPVETLRPAA